MGGGGPPQDPEASHPGGGGELGWKGEGLPTQYPDHGASAPPLGRGRGAGGEEFKKAVRSTKVFQFIIFWMEMGVGQDTS